MFKDNFYKLAAILIAITIAFVIANKAYSERTTNVLTQPILNVPGNVENKVLTRPPSNTPVKIDKPVLKLEGETNNTLFLFGEVRDANSEEISQSIMKLNGDRNQTPIMLVIDSPGGSVFAGVKVISAIEASKRPVYTICYGMCASMAAMIHQYGTKRLMVDRSVLMFHNASGGAQGEINQMLSQLHFVNSFCNKMDAFIAKRANMNLSTFTEMCNSQIWIDAEDSLNQGFSDQTTSINLSKVDKAQLVQFNNYRKNHNKKNNVETVLDGVMNNVTR